MARRALVIIFSVVTFISVKIVNGSLQEQIAEYSNVCCTAGVAYAQSHPAGPSACSSAIPPEDVPQNYGPGCLFAMDGCCKDYFTERSECEAGKLLAPSKECGKVASIIGQNCCEECSVGRLAGSSQGKQACQRVSSEEEEGSSSIVLRKKAYSSCCVEAAAEQDAARPPTHEDPDFEEIKPEDPVSITKVPSLCEQFAPDELCAHHCIPIPGSYRCECNPGFMLMPDGKSCRKVEKNRCKPKNPCQHKCNDNGKEVKCSCKRGYELMSDKKSCKDVDECTLSIAMCLDGTTCHNTEGSYKCIPIKRGATNDYGGNCPAGFERNYQNQVCDDINECEQPHPPCPKYLCANTVGGYTCGGVPGKPLSPQATPLDIPQASSPPPREEDRCPPGFRAGVDEECVDIDECTEEANDCNPQSQFCLNTLGSFACQDKASKHCAPGFKYNAKTGVCGDIDECVDAQDLCPSDQMCVNVPGAYACKPKTGSQPKLPKSCPEGTRMRPQGQVCEDIDECREGTHLCDQFQNCLNTFGSHECRCRVGFRLDPTTEACIDINECAEDGLNECVAESQRCDNTVGSYVCTRFTSCGTGYVLHAASGKCEDIDECLHKLDNCQRAGPSFQCVNLPGTFRCVRKRIATTTSTTLPPYEYEYYDSDEDIPTDNKNLPKPSDASSPAPTTKKEETSTTQHPIPTEPTQPQPVYTEPSTTTERTTPKSYNNYDNPPYTNQPIPEPKPREENPEENSTTNDLKPDPYDPKQNEPPTPTTSKSDENVVIPPRANEPKIVMVRPPENPITMPRVKDENGTIFINTQDVAKNRWTNVIGTEREVDEDKHCVVGYFKDEYGNCVDYDECATGHHVCSSMTEVCRNSDGGYQCDCAPGFIKDPVTGWCKTLASSSTSTSTTTSTTTAAPTPPFFNHNWTPTQRPYRPFRPRLICDAGYHLNSNTGKCEDVNECTNGLASCAAVEICINTEGGYRCECPPNWMLDAAGHRCVPARDPAQYPSGYGNVYTEPTPKPSAPGSVITVGSQYGHRGSKYVAPSIRKLPDSGSILTSCPWGYKLTDEGRCVDVDECSAGIAACGATQICANHAGGYTCRCPPGHRLAGDNSCEDIDECALSQGRYCSAHSDCVNTIGSYQCRCHRGFRTAPANDKVCADVDECSEARPGVLCQQTCNNVWGSYRCSCHRGYKLASDNRTCVDVDECTEYASRNLCIGRCFNDPGSYRCSCPQGYRLGGDNRSCIDIDECETGEATCAGAAGDRVCQNTRGGYKCHQVTCPPGYQLERKHRCTRTLNMCPLGDWECAHQPSTYSYNFITFVSKLYIPPAPLDHVDLFTMRGPSWQNSVLKFQLRLVNINAPPSVREPADISCFNLTPTANQAVVSLVRSLEGPQSIELELSMELYTEGNFGGNAVAKIFIYVSEYEF